MKFTKNEMDFFVFWYVCANSVAVSVNAVPSDGKVCFGYDGIYHRSPNTLSK